MERHPSLNWLVPTIILLALIAAGVGLSSQGGGNPFVFTTLHGQSVQMYGQGLYAYDTLFSAGIYKGTDIITLVLFIPALILSMLLYRKGSLRGAFLLTGTLAIFLYNGASMAFGAAYNNLFLVYTALLGTSLFAFVLAFTSIDSHSFSQRVTDHFPFRGLAVFLCIAGLAPVVLWLGDILSALSKGRVPDLLSSYTTMFTYAIDLGVIVPAVYLAAVLLLRRAPLGYLLSFVMLILLTSVGLGVVTQTLFQLSLGITYNSGQSRQSEKIFLK